MRITYNRTSDAAYIYLQDDIPAGGVARTYPCETSEANAEINLDFDAEGRLIGIEVLDASKKMPRELLDRARKG